MRFFILALGVLFVSGTAVAQKPLSKDNDGYAEQLCAKVKQCRLGKILAKDMPEFMQDFIVQTVDTQCVNIASSYHDQIIEADLEDKAKSCVHSLEKQSCKQMLEAGSEPNTQQCNNFLKSAEAAGIDFSKIKF